MVLTDVCQHDDVRVGQTLIEQPGRILCNPLILEDSDVVWLVRIEFGDELSDETDILVERRSRPPSFDRMDLAVVDQ